MWNEFCYMIQRRLSNFMFLVRGTNNEKNILAVLAATAVLGVTSAFAANPFSDVTPQDWAYQAVAQLASQGIVNGYPDGTFKGQQKHHSL